MRFSNIPKEVIELIKLLNKNEYEAYIVGGCVRDLFLNKNPHDWDMCTNASPKKMLEIFQKNYSINPKGLKFGTVTVVEKGEEYEITTYRTDGNYNDGRHPEDVNFVKDIKEDLARRDFTINAMAYNPITDELVDYYHGLEDLNKGIIRCVGDADKRFKEDSLRIVRALRFAIKFGFDIDINTYNEMIKNKELLDNISKERITSEFEKILTSEKPISFWFQEAAPIIFQLIPELEPCYQFDQNNKYHKHDIYEHCLAVADDCKTNDFIIKLAGLLHDIGKPHTYTIDEEGHGHFYGHPEVSYEITKELVDKRFRLTNKQKEALINLVKEHDRMVTPTTKSIRRMLSEYDKEFIDKWFILKRADINDHVFPDTSKKPIWIQIDEIYDVYKEVLEQENCLSLKDLEINGNDIIDILHPEDKKDIGAYLRIIFEKVLNEEIENKKDTLINYLKELSKSITKEELDKYKDNKKDKENNVLNKDNFNEIIKDAKTRCEKQKEDLKGNSYLLKQYETIR